MDIEESIKSILAERAESRIAECRDTDDHDKLLRAQGAARELKEILEQIDLLENPPKQEILDK